MIQSVSHVALRMDDVLAAEAYYRRLLALDVAFRDVYFDGMWHSLPPSVDWAEAAERGLVPGLSALHRGGFVLALEQDAGAGPGRLDHIGLDVDPEELQQQRARLAGEGCTVDTDREDLLVFRDRYAVRWELTAARYAHPADQGTGARTGRWLHLNTAAGASRPVLG